MHFSPKRPAAPGGLALGLAALGLIALAPTTAHAQTQNLFVSNADGTISRFAGTGPGTVSTTSTPVTAPSLAFPAGLAFDTRGDLFAANSNVGSNTVTEFTAGSTPGTFGATTTLSGGGLSEAEGVAVDAQGDLFVSNFFDRTTTTDSITEFASTGPGTFGQGAIVETGLNGPEGLAFDARGDLFAANAGSRSLVGANTIIEFAAGATPGTLGTATTISAPNIKFLSSVAVDARGDLFAADAGSNSPGGNNPQGTVTEFAVNPVTGGFLPGQIIISGLNLPNALAFDAGGDLFASNAGAASIVKFALNPATGTFGAAQTVETGDAAKFLAFSLASPVPEASTVVSLGLLLMLGMGGVVVAARKKRKA